ncbi:MAG: S8/S53 family peptidase [Sedimentisphaerales bacterium]
MRRVTTVLLTLVGILLAGSDGVGASQQEKSKHTIVPGVGIGDYTLGMSKDDLLSKLGEPEAVQLGEDEVVRRGEERYSLNNLPREYILSFHDVSFWLENDSVQVINVHSPLYKLGNGLGVGDSEQKIKQAFGEDFQPREALGKNYHCYHAKGLGFVIHEENRTVAEIVVYEPEGDRRQGRDRVLESLPRRNPKSTESRQVDLRGRDVSRLDLRKSLDDLLYADFDSRTTWPTADRMPEGFDHERIMEFGKNPGLGVRKVHERGITGRGIGVAIVDQVLLTKHKEYADRLRFYEEINVRPGTDPQMHGAAVASIAVGKTVGVAPEADLYYIGSWTGDWGKGKDGFEWNFAYYAQAVRRILEINKQLPDDRKIRVISMSVGWTSKRKGYDEMTAAVDEAKKAGMLVVCSFIDDVHGFVFDGLDRTPLSDPDDFASNEPGLWLAEEFYRGQRKWNQLWVPMGSRTTAAANGVDEYVFHRQGGWSWAIPYVAGVYALAAQVDPEITPERFWKLAMKTGRTIELEHEGERHSFGPIIDPVALISTLQKE